MLRSELCCLGVDGDGQAQDAVGVPHRHAHGVAKLLLGPQRVENRFLHQQHNCLKNGLISDGPRPRLVIVCDKCIGVSGSGETVASDNVDTRWELHTPDVRDTIWTKRTRGQSAPHHGVHLPCLSFRHVTLHQALGEQLTLKLLGKVFNLGINL